MQKCVDAIRESIQKYQKLQLEKANTLLKSSHFDTTTQFHFDNDLEF